MACQLRARWRSEQPTHITDLSVTHTNTHTYTLAQFQFRNMKTRDFLGKIISFVSQDRQTEKIILVSLSLFDKYECNQNLIQKNVD